LCSERIGRIVFPPGEKRKEEVGPYDMDRKSNPNSNVLCSIGPHRSFVVYAQLVTGTLGHSDATTTINGKQISGLVIGATFNVK
jgi:hypothetical protein